MKRGFHLDERAAGLLLHVTSLPGRFGAGGFGAEARAFVDFVASARLRWWQMLPIGPGGGSPYSSTSVFAADPMLIDIDRLVRDGLLEESELPSPEPHGRRADFDANRRVRRALLERAFERAKPAGWHLEERRAYFDREAWWLADYALYAALKRAHGETPYWAWPTGLRRHDDAALAAFARDHNGTIELEIFLQYLLARDLEALHAYASARGVGLMGDAPIFVAHDSADVWAHPELFAIDPKGELTEVAGVPPDAFSDEGQLWGNPLYDWERIAETGYRFWIARLGKAFDSFDCIRLDHFIGFQRYWAVPRASKTAKAGAYRKGPGRALFSALKSALGDVPIVAEDLGVLTDEVRALRDGQKFPGMNVLQFSFDPSPGAESGRPHRYAKRSVVYTGTHDNDTLAGWLGGPPGDASTEVRASYERERAFALKYLGLPADAPLRTAVDAFVRAAFANQADLAMVPVQDVLALGRDARMNRPGVAEGNWTFRVRPDDLGADAAARLRDLATTYGRAIERSAKDEAK
ncbi:MAG: 4-alpha-glucanotransferase [Polyangiaceae bacterium]